VDSIPLLGRQAELDRIQELLDALPARGGSLLVRGDAGVGKTAMLAEARRLASARGVRVLAAVGIQSETQIPFSGLHQLLAPLRASDSGDWAVVQAAFGDAPDDVFRISLATLNVLADAADHRPVLLLLDDVHWLDDATNRVLAFTARRLEHDAIALLGAARMGSPSAFDGSDIPELRLHSLADAAAERLLDLRAPELPRGVRRRILDEAAGNALALVELSAAGAELEDTTLLASGLPLSVRLERTFQSRMRDLPPAARTLALVAALHDRGDVRELIDATRRLDPAIDETALKPLAETGLVTTDGTTLRFRHPLTRSAVTGEAREPLRIAAHRALAATLADRPDAALWHRAAAALGPDERLAAALESLADRSERRGGLASAAAALERAAALTPGTADRHRRSIRAAALAVELGRADVARRLVADVEHGELSAAEEAQLALIDVLVDPLAPRDAGRVASLIAVARRAGEAGESALALDLLWTVANRRFWSDGDDAIRDAVLDATGRVATSASDPRRLSVLTYADPIALGAAVLERIEAWRTAPPPDPITTLLLANSAVTLGANELATTFLDAAIDGLRRQGRLVQLTQALVLRGFAAMHLGRWTVAVLDGAEATRLARETDQPVWGAAAEILEHTLAGLGGGEQRGDPFLDAERVGHELGARAVLNFVQYGRAVLSLARGEADDAYGHLRRMFDPTDPAYHRMESCWSIGNLAEAAVQTGNAAAARIAVAELEPLARESGSPWSHIALRHARAVLAPDDQAQAEYDAAFAADLSGWPLDWARLSLAYGRWLRGRRRIAESRAHLRAARDAFDALGVVAWGQQARDELERTGEASPQRPDTALQQLTAQELQIARLAAQGLSNREIGEQLYLSPRTVASHLYRAFPKLGVASRAQLAPALLTSPEPGLVTDA
jgi:DNA-binding CsgD family transcriptional regulator